MLRTLKTTNTNAGQGSIAGASGDAGVEYRRGVAAYVVAFGLVGSPLLGFGVPAADALVQFVALETEDPLDDIRVNFRSGWTALIQAKRTLEKGKNFRKAVDQWIAAARSPLAADTHRFVIVGGQVSGPIKALQQVLKRNQSDVPGPPTKAEAEALDYLDEMLVDLTPEQREVVYKCAVIYELSVEDPADKDAKLATQYLAQLVSNAESLEALNAWNALTAAAGKSARLRAGYSLEGWLMELRGAGVSIDPGGKAPAAELERKYAAIERYKERLIRAGSFLDLRGLGAQIPPIPLLEADAKVQVGTKQEEAGVEIDLLWAFLRRGRVVLTGLPGGGKSTAIRYLAARLCTLPGAPLPVLVSLKDVDALGSTTSFRDRLLTAAVRDDAPEDRIIVRNELEQRLSAGHVALLLDSLDETYDRRAAVASEIDGFMASVSNDVDALLSTRDVAYGQAATLGWANLSLRPPLEAERVVEAVLKLSAERKSPQLESDRWVEERVRWVKEALSGGKILRETPLLPVLLALLAAEKNLDTLPPGRARVLAAVVNDAVARHEVTRQSPHSLGPLNDSEIYSAAMHAFAVEASAILDSNGSIKLDDLLPLVTKEVAAHWDLGPGYAASLARDIVRFFDAIGIFVISGASETVAPRIALFAEIGDALRASSEPDRITDWVRTRIQARQFEPLILAAGLGQAAAGVLGRIAGESHDRELLHAAVRAIEEGADISDVDQQSICARLIDDLGTGAPAAWASWTQLLQLSFAADKRDAIEAAVRSFDQQRQKLVSAELDLKFRSREELLHAPQSMLAVLELDHLPHIPSAERQPRFDLAEFLQIDQLGKVQFAAAELLLGNVPEATELILERAKDGPPGLKDDLTKLLKQRGLDAEAGSISQPGIDWKNLAWFRDYDPESDRTFLTLLADRQIADLTFQQQTRCDELADLMATLSLNDVSSIYMFKHVEDVGRVIELAEALFGFDSAVVAAQANLIIQRMDFAGDSQPYYALFDNAKPRRRHDWTEVRDVESAIALLGRMMTWGKAHAWFVAAALWDAPVSGPASVMLRQRLPQLARSSAHLRIAALTLCSLVDGPEPLSWTTDPDPVLRSVAAELCESSANGYLTEQHQVLLNDSDRGVRFTALDRAAKLHPPDVEELLSRATKQPPTGWMCRSCRTVNTPESESCSKSSCFHVPPRLSKRTQKLLERFR